MKRIISFALTLTLGVCIGAGSLSLISRSEAVTIDKTAKLTNDPIYINGQKTDVEVYKIDGSNYFKLRDLGKALNFYVGWSWEQGVYIDGDMPYEESGSTVNTAAAELFNQLNGKNFSFASGAGGWCTEVVFGPNGTFKGNYHDSDMGDTGYNYPNGTVYICDFDGAFDDVTKIDAYTYSMRLKELNTDRMPDDVEISEGVKYIYSDPYGLDNADVFYVDLYTSIWLSILFW